MRLLQSKLPPRQLVQRLLKQPVAAPHCIEKDSPRVTLRAEGTSLETIALQALALRSFSSTAQRGS
ncbi:hypothetical protein VW040_16095 [Phaeobacter sp. JH85H1]|uniref:hypothetical protein n=1 Tax=unclassified Phaeobacter TaxID=2621772 RepID=UPI003A8B4452